MKAINDVRRRLLLVGLISPSLSALSGCRASLPRATATISTPEGLRILQESAVAHGMRGFSAIADVSVAYTGKWHRLVTKLQPDLVDAGFRGGSEERFLINDGIVAQSHHGPKGHKQVVRTLSERTQGDVRVWFNDHETHDAVRLQAAALVVDGYLLFLLGPLYIAQLVSAIRSAIVELVGIETVSDGREQYQCDLLSVQLQPGLGYSDGDQFVLYIDHTTRLMRRVRLTLRGLESTLGALVEVDTFDHIERGGVAWPTRFHERLLRPLPLKVHDWRLSGLDLDRGYKVEDVSDMNFSGLAKRPARPLDPKS